MTVTARFVPTLLLGALWTGLALAVTPYLVDGDGDAVSDEIDDCPYTQPGVQVNRLGCPLRRDDGDVDGVVDDEDQCPYTVKGAQVDLQGCALDSDFDGVANGLDRCSDTPLAALVNEGGCARGEKASAVGKITSTAPEPAARVVLGPIPARQESPSSQAKTSSAAEPQSGAILAEEPQLLLRFRSGSARLGSGDLAQIKAYSTVFLRRLAADPQRKLQLRAAADGSEPEAETVLVARAVAVQAALVGHGIAAERLVIERELSTTGAAANRRVEVGLRG